MPFNGRIRSATNYNQTQKPTKNNQRQAKETDQILFVGMLLNLLASKRAKQKGYYTGNLKKDGTKKSHPFCIQKLMRAESVPFFYSAFSFNISIAFSSAEGNGTPINPAFSVRLIISFKQKPMQTASLK